MADEATPKTEQKAPAKRASKAAPKVAENQTVLPSGNVVTQY